MRHRGELADRVVAITGAGGGIGRQLAFQAADRGARLSLSDWDADALDRTVDTIGTRVKVEARPLNVADRAAMAQWAADTAASFGQVNMLINNAGVSATGDVLDLSYDDVDWIVGINLMGVVNGTKEFLPHLVESDDGYLVNISSLFGLVSMPGQSIYNATKFAVRGFTEAVREEMLVGGHSVRVTCVHPGGVKTGIARNGRKAAAVNARALDSLFENRLARTSAADAATTILNGALAGRPRVLVGADAHLLHQFARLVGARYQEVVALAAPRILP